MKIKEAKKQLEETKTKLDIANKSVEQHIEIIAMLGKQLAQQDKAIARKDAQFLGLRSAYQDEIINKGR